MPAAGSRTGCGCGCGCDCVSYSCSFPASLGPPPPPPPSSPFPAPRWSRTLRRCGPVTSATAAASTAALSSSVSRLVDESGGCAPAAAWACPGPRPGSLQLPVARCGDASPAAAAAASWPERVCWWDGPAGVAGAATASACGAGSSSGSNSSNASTNLVATHRQSSGWRWRQWCRAMLSGGACVCMQGFARRA